MFYIYILTNKNRTVLYTGVTRDLQKRVWEHKMKQKDGFTKRYNVDRLVYFETTTEAMVAIQREKSIKNLLRVKKEALINSMNPEWNDLSLDF
jgi:putative endonuclease